MPEANIVRITCRCGSVELALTGDPIAQYHCHCDDCQAVHGAAYACMLYPAAAVAVRGPTDAFVLRTTPRTRCPRCETYLFAEVPGIDVRGVNGLLLPSGAYRPQFHIQCQYVKVPIEDDLPHFKGLPTKFGGSGELMPW